MNNVHNKTALITGGANGIGYSIAQELLQNGAKCIAILDLPTSNGTNSVANLEKVYGKGKAIFFPCDVSKGADFEDTFKKVVDAFNGLDIVVNNAGIFDEIRWEETLNLNTTTVIRGCLLAIKVMNKQTGGKGGTILNVASIAGLTAMSPAIVYSASKYAVVGYGQALQQAYKWTGVRVLTICPGVTATTLVKNGLKGKILDFLDFEGATKEFTALPSQPVEVVGRSMLQLIEKGENGAIWVVEDSKPAYPIQMPYYADNAVSINK